MILGLFTPVVLLAADKAPSPLLAAKAAKAMILPKGFRATVYAAEPDVVQPISFCIDARGRLWVAEALNYGAWQPTALNVAQCVGDIGNHNGNLGCQGGKPASPSPAPPKLDIASLVIAPDGSMFGYSREQKLVRITAVAPGQLELSNEILGLSKDGKALVKNNDMTFRAGEVVTEPNLTLPANTNINIVAEKGIAFRPGLHIVAGARLHAGMGN